tara:strand:+ start:618 stop:923 length:306 start_codon:yes stop_codon:yes gene_type:complete
MNWLKTLWGQIVNKTSAATQLQEAIPVEVEESESVIEIFERICTEAGLGSKFTEGLGASEKFVEWYDGPAEESAIRESLAEFKTVHPSINAKMTSAMGVSK